MPQLGKNIWMYGVIAVFVGFAVLMSYFAIIASRNKESLVVKDYYKAELEYQKQIDKMANTAALPVQPRIVLTLDQIEVLFAPEINAVEKGQITLYRANNPDQDIHIPLKPLTSGKQGIPLSIIEKGAWKVKLDWESAGKGYYFEKDIYVSK